jgi:hypothetical protein
MDSAITAFIVVDFNLKFDYINVSPSKYYSLQKMNVYGWNDKNIFMR